MVTEFKDMGGPSAFEIGAFQRWIQSMWLRNICSEKRLLNKRKREDSSRAKEGQHHVVEFFACSTAYYSINRQIEEEGVFQTPTTHQIFRS